MELAFESTVNDNGKLTEENTIIKKVCEDLRRRLTEDDGRIALGEQYSGR